jgi:hypothetical protein
MLPGPWPAQRVPGNPVHQRDFWFGFGGWITVNVILLILLTQLPVDSKSAVGGALLVANVLALILLAFLRGYVALGMVTAFATALAVVVVEGIFFTLSDFAGGLYSTGTMVGFLVTGGLLFAVVAFFLLRAIHRSIR